MQQGVQQGVPPPALTTGELPGSRPGKGKKKSRELEVLHTRHGLLALAVALPVSRANLKPTPGSPG